MLGDGQDGLAGAVREPLDAFAGSMAVQERARAKMNQRLGKVTTARFSGHDGGTYQLSAE